MSDLVITPLPPITGEHDSPIIGGEGVISAFLDGRGERTRQAYARDLDDFARFCAAPDASTACAWLLSRGQGSANRLTLAYRAHLRERGLSPATINRRLAALRSLSKLARLVGVCEWALEVPGLPSEAYRDTRGPGVVAVKAMLDGAKSSRDRAILHLLYDLGLRRGEVVALDFADLDLARGTLLVIGKGRLEKSPLSLPPAALEALAAWLDARGEKPGPLFTNFDRSGKGDGRLTGTSLYRIVKESAGAVGAKATPHGLRHTAITEACKAAASAGIGLDEVLDFSRHKSVATLMRYRDRERNLQGQLAKLVAEAAT